MYKDDSDDLSTLAKRCRTAEMLREDGDTIELMRVIAKRCEIYRNLEEFAPGLCMEFFNWLYATQMDYLESNNDEYFKGRYEMVKEILMYMERNGWLTYGKTEQEVKKNYKYYKSEYEGAEHE